jgi:hypothetical protein
LKREIVGAIMAMKNRKAAADILLPLFLDIWQKEKFPNKWNEGIIIKAPKNGDLSQCRNWWGIILLVVISKMFNKILLEH